jgi:glucokinase
MSTIRVTLGIDIGGTNTAMAIVDRDGKILAKDSIATMAMDPAADLFKRLFEKFNMLFNPLKGKYYELAGVGIGAPNANYYKGTIENPPNLNWGVVDVVSLVKNYYDIPVAITNDANAAALGEMRFGVAKGMKNFIQITLGTGLGSGIVINGELLYGSDGFAGEMGHTTIVRDGRKCACGKRGCLETYVSAPGLKRTVFEMMAEMTEKSILRDYCFKDLTAKNIYEAAITGDKIAQAAFKLTGRYLGQAMADAVAYLSPEAFVIFGGLANSGDLLLEPVKKHLENNLLNAFKGKIKILSSGLPEGDAAVLGAAALIWHELSNKEN